MSRFDAYERPVEEVYEMAQEVGIRLSMADAEAIARGEKPLVGKYTAKGIVRTFNPRFLARPRGDWRLREPDWRAYFA